MLKPWYSQERKVDDYFNIQGLAFYTKDDYDDSVPSYFNGDVMVEIPKMGYQFKNINNTQEVSITRENELSGFCYDAFRRGNNYNDYIYVSAYEATKREGETRAHSLNRAFSENFDRNHFTADDELRAWTGLTNNWSILTYQAYTLLGVLSLLYNKSISSTVYSQDTFLGIKDLINATRYYTLEGLKIKNNQFYNKFSNFSNTEGWNLLLENVQAIKSNSVPSLIYATNDLGFFPKEGLGTTSTYYTMSIPY